MTSLLAQIVSLDQNIIHAITGLQNSLLDPIMIGFTKIGDLGAIWIILTIMLILWKNYRYEGIVIASGLFINIVLGEGILKHIFKRARLFLELPDIVLKIPAPITSSFPSGHTSVSWCFALIFTYFFWRKSQIAVVIVWVIAFGITFSRLYLQVHYPSDILAGALVGIISATLAIYFSHKKSNKTTS